MYSLSIYMYRDDGVYFPSSSWFYSSMFRGGWKFGCNTGSVPPLPQLAMHAVFCVDGGIRYTYDLTSSRVAFPQFKSPELGVPPCTTIVAWVPCNKKEVYYRSFADRLMVPRRLKSKWKRLRLHLGHLGHLGLCFIPDSPQDLHAQTGCGLWRPGVHVATSIPGIGFEWRSVHCSQQQCPSQLGSSHGRNVDRDIENHRDMGSWYTIDTRTAYIQLEH